MLVPWQVQESCCLEAKLEEHQVRRGEQRHDLYTYGFSLLQLLVGKNHRKNSFSKPVSREGSIGREEQTTVK